MKTYCVYIMASASRTLYTGVTNNLERRVSEHQRKLIPGFTSQYNINRLVHYEVFGDIRAAIAREKQIMGWRRTKKVALIESKQSRLGGLERRMVWRQASISAGNTAEVVR